VIALPEELEKGLSGLIGGPLHVAYYAVNQGVISRNPKIVVPLIRGFWDVIFSKGDLMDIGEKCARVVMRILLRRWNNLFWGLK